MHPVSGALSRFTRPHDKHDDVDITVLSFHISLQTTRRRLRQQLATNAFEEEDMVDPEDMNPLISLEPEYADYIRAVASGQEQVASCVSEELHHLR